MDVAFSRIEEVVSAHDRERLLGVLEAASGEVAFSLQGGDEERRQTLVSLLRRVYRTLLRRDDIPVDLETSSAYYAGWIAGLKQAMEAGIRSIVPQLVTVTVLQQPMLRKILVELDKYVELQQSTLAKFADIDPGNLSKALGELEQLQLVTRTRTSGNVNLVQLTSLGSSVAQDCRANEERERDSVVFRMAGAVAEPVGAIPQLARGRIRFCAYGHHSTIDKFTKLMDKIPTKGVQNAPCHSVRQEERELASFELNV